jgi:hypothetical protein
MDDPHERCGGDAEMPIARYFFFVGGVLLALLFLSDAVLPQVPVADRTVADLPVIRIHSDRKWPERVVFDTSIRAVAPVQTAKAQVDVPAPSTVADVSGKVRDAFAQLQPSDAKQLESSNPKMPDPKLPPKRKVAKKHIAPPTVLVAQHPQFGFFASNTW